MIDFQAYIRACLNTFKKNRSPTSATFKEIKVSKIRSGSKYNLTIFVAKETDFDDDVIITKSEKQSRFSPPQHRFTSSTKIIK